MISKKLVFILSISFFILSCGPSLQYRAGQGFYSDIYSKQQVQTAIKEGKVQNLGRFSVGRGTCMNYTYALADQHIVIPAVRFKLKEMGGNVAENEDATEKWFVDILLGILIIPGYLGCSNWTISGDALLVTDY